MRVLAGERQRYINRVGCPDLRTRCMSPLWTYQHGLSTQSPYYYSALNASRVGLLLPLTGTFISHTLYHFLSCLISVSARRGGGVPRKVRRHLTSVKCVREVRSVILPGLPPRGALGCVRPGSTVTTATHNVRTAGKAGTSPSRTVLYACLAPSRRRPWGRAAPSVSATKGSLAVLQVEEAQERPM